jgi:hypothetical protein
MTFWPDSVSQEIKWCYEGVMPLHRAVSGEDCMLVGTLVLTTPPYIPECARAQGNGSLGTGLYLEKVLIMILIRSE